MKTPLTVSIHEAKTHLSKLIQKVLDGEEVIIANRSVPVVKLEAIKQEKAALQFGGLKSLNLVMGDSFDEPIDDFAEYGPTSISKVAEDPTGYQS